MQLSKAQEYIIGIIKETGEVTAQKLAKILFPKDINQYGYATPESSYKVASILDNFVNSHLLIKNDGNYSIKKEEVMEINTEISYNTLADFKENVSDEEITFHDLNNDFAIILTNLDMLSKEEEIPEKFRKKLAKIFDRAKKCYKVIKDNIFDSFEKNINIDIIIKDILSEWELSEVYLTKNINNLKLKTKPKIIKSIIRNMVSNSVRELQQINSTKKLSISCGIENNNNVIIIEDNGKGIKEEDLDKIFKKGYSKYGSSGKGLCYCYNKIKEMGGKLHVSSNTLERRTSFTIILPINIKKKNNHGTNKSISNTE